MEEQQYRIVPLDAIRAFHNAFRNDIIAIDAAAYSAACGSGSLDFVLKRYTFFNEVLVWHARGEEETVFPALEKVAPLVAEAYERDHRGLDSLFESLSKAVTTTETLLIARTTAAFDLHLGIHLSKEEAHLYRIFNDRISLRNQWDIVGKMYQKIPQNRFSEVVAWLFPLVGINDRENMTRIWRQAGPGLPFERITKLIQAAIGDDWVELTSRIPELK